MKAGNLLTNGSFEDNNGDAGTWSSLADLPGWTVNGQLDLWRGMDAGLPGAPADDQSQVEIDEKLGDAGLSQSVNLTAGTTYALEFSLAQPANDGTAHMVDVYWNGALVASVGPSSTDWTHFRLDLTGQDGANQITFKKHADGETNAGVLLDQVSLTAASEAGDPAPSTVVVQVVAPDIAPAPVDNPTDAVGPSDAAADAQPVAQPSDPNSSAVSDAGTPANTPDPAGNLVADGSFEAITPDDFGGVYVSATAGAWHGENGGNVEAWRYYNTLPYMTADGPTLIALDGTQGAGAVSQDVTVEAGKVYALDFSLAQRIDTTGNDAVDILWNGKTVATITPATTDWSRFRLLVTGDDSGMDTLTFKQHGTEGYGSLLDNVSLVDANYAADAQSNGITVVTDTVFDAAAAAQAAVASDPANLIVNGSFEVNNFGTIVSAAGVHVLEGWTSDTGTILLSHDWAMAPDFAAAQGQSFVSLANMWGGSDITQTVTKTVADNTYALEFSLAKPLDSVGTDAVDVYWNGNLIQTVAPASSDWSRFRINVVAQGNDVLTFKQHSGDVMSSHIDDITLVDASQAPDAAAANVTVLDSMMAGGTAQSDGNTAVVAPVTPGDLILNGSFEWNDFGSHNGTSIFHLMSGWSSPTDWMQATHGASELPDSSLSGDATAMVLAKSWIDTQTIGQDVTTQANATYDLKFSLAQRTDQPVNPNWVEVMWNGQLVAKVSPTDMHWNDFALTVVGTGQVDNLTFREQGGDSDCGVLLDHVSLVAEKHDPLAA